MNDTYLTHKRYLNETSFTHQSYMIDTSKWEGEEDLDRLSRRDARRGAGKLIDDLRMNRLTLKSFSDALQGVSMQSEVISLEVKSSRREAC